MTVHAQRFLKIVLPLAVACAAFGIWVLYLLSPLTSPVSSLVITEYHRILDRYAFGRLSQKTPIASPIQIGKVLKRDPAFTSYEFTFLSDGATVSGQLNLPSTGQNLPVIVMVRGYVDKEIYYTGLGTRPASEVLARHGYITIAPDFLGYGDSASESADIFVSRFEKPATVVNLLASIPSLKQANPAKIGIWGHSNGGQISLSVLEVTKHPYPTVLWAPVTQSFPDSILQYLDELPDKGAYIKAQLELFHQHYQDSDYDIDEHLKDITAKLQIHQGGADELVDHTQTDTTVATLKNDGISVNYFTYPNENHNFNNGSFTLMTTRDVAFFDSQLK